jgi:hypothetical protein
MLGKEFEFTENWGKSGGGNHFIFNSVVECSLRHKFTPEDTVIVMWTNILREDRYVDNKWISPGNMYTTTIYTKEYVEKYIDIKGCLIRDLAFIHGTKKYLESLGVKHIFLSMVPIINWDQYSSKKVENADPICQLYTDTLNFIRVSMFESVYKNDWHSKPRIVFDSHPSPSVHLEYLQTVLPEYPLSSSTIAWVNEIEQAIINQSDPKTTKVNQINISKYWKYVVPDRF